MADQTASPPAAAGNATSVPTDTSGKPPAPPPGTQPAEQPNHSFAAAAKYEKELRAAREERAKLEARLKELEPRVARADELESWKKGATLDPDAFLKPLYGDKWYETLTKAKLGDDSSVQIKALRDEMRAELEAERKKWADKEAESQKVADEERSKLEAERQKEEEDYKLETREFVEANKDQYEVINALGLQEIVANKPKQHFEQTKKVLSYKEAADLVEQDLDKAIEKVLGTKKWQGRLAEMAKAAQPTRVAPEFTRRAVSNDLAAGTTQQNKRLTRAEREERAVKKLEEWEAARVKQAQ